MPAVMLAVLGCTSGTRQQELKVFEREMKRVSERVCPAVSSSLASGKTSGLTPLIEEAKADLARTGQPLRASVGVLDRNGIVVGGDGDVAPHETENYSAHQAVVYVMEEGNPAAGRIYDQKDGRSYIFCLPVRQGKSIVGVLVLIFNDEVLKSRYGVTGEEIVAYDFDW
jgi:hypothetical protein